MKKLFKDQDSTQLATVNPAAKLEQPGYKAMQYTFKEIALKAMLDKEYRELCLQDSQAAIRKVIQRDAAIPDNIIFLEEDGEALEGNVQAYVLPPFLKPSWLTSK